VSFYELLMRITREYNKPLLEITENGCSYLDAPDGHGKIPDQRRIDFTRGYLSALGRAMKDAANVRRYHHSSLMVNFEWAEGYAQRFGLVYVDFRDSRRLVRQTRRLRLPHVGWDLQTWVRRPGHLGKPCGSLRAVRLLC
jgi:beta-glucosidase